MKIIEALKKIKYLVNKTADIKKLVSENCVDLDCEIPAYPNQLEQVASWIQSHKDTVKEILRLRKCIIKTNLETHLTLDIGGEQVTKSIFEWLNRKKDLIALEKMLYSSLGHGQWEKDEYRQTITPKAPERVYKRRLYYDVSEKNKNLEMLELEKSLIEPALEIVNASTDLIEI